MSSRDHTQLLSSVGVGIAVQVIEFVSVLGPRGWLAAGMVAARSLLRLGLDGFHVTALGSPSAHVFRYLIVCF